MGIDITVRKNAEAATEQYARRLQATSHRLLTVQEAERRTLARELHDAVGQELTALSLNLTIIDGALPDTTPRKSAGASRGLAGAAGGDNAAPAEYHGGVAAARAG